MPSLCQNLKESYEHLTKLTAEFTAKYHAVKEAGDLSEVKRLRKGLEAARDALLEQLALFVVPNAKNPHREALIEAGLDPSKTKERQETRLDLRKEIERQLSVYRDVRDKDGKPLLEEWVKDITEKEGLIYAEVAKDRAKIIERIKEGMIPVLMPSRDVQERTWEVALTHLQPLWMKDGKKEALDEKNYLYGAYKTDSTKKMTKKGFFKNIPDRPYLVWVKPTQGLDSNTLNKTFENQQALYASMATDNKTKNLYDPTDLIPTEYVALQALFTRDVERQFEEQEGKRKKPKTIRPLDYYDSSSACTFTRFLSAGPFSVGGVPIAYFRPGSRQVNVDNDNPDANDKSGFRPAARVFSSSKKTFRPKTTLKKRLIQFSFKVSVDISISVVQK